MESAPEISHEEQQVIWNNEQSINHIEALQVYQQNLLARINFAFGEQETLKKSIEELTNTDKEIQTNYFKSYKKFENLQRENFELESKKSKLIQSKEKNSEEIINLTKEIEKNVNTEKNAEKISKEYKSIEDSEEVKVKKGQIHDLQEELIRIQEVFDRELEILTCNYEEIIFKKKRESKLAKFIELIKYRTISSKAQIDELVKKDQVESDLNVVNENIENFNKFLRKDLEKPDQENGPEDEEPQVYVQKNFEIKLKHILLVVIGYLIFGIFYSKFFSTKIKSR